MKNSKSRLVAYYIKVNTSKLQQTWKIIWNLYFSCLFGQMSITDACVTKTTIVSQRRFVVITTLIYYINYFLYLSFELFRDDLFGGEG